MFPNRVPMGSDTLSPEPLVYLAFIHVHLPQSPKRSPPTNIGEKNMRSPSTEPHADGKPTYNGVWPGSPRCVGHSGCTFEGIHLQPLPC